MTILIYTSMWKRYHISELFALGIKRFIKDAPEDIKCIVHATVSDEESKAICIKHGFYHTMCENNPVGNKWNKGLERCIHDYEWDYLLIMGDDDLISSDAWKHCKPYLQGGIDYFGFNSIYFYDLATHKALEFTYESKLNSGDYGRIIGCGRMVSRKAIEKSAFYSKVRFLSTFSHGHYRYWKNDVIDLPTYQAKYLVGTGRAEMVGDRYFALWDCEQERGLDNESEIRLLSNGFTIHCISTERAMMIDVKTQRNINHYDKFEKNAQSIAVDTDTALAVMQKKEIRYINFLRKQPCNV